MPVAGHVAGTLFAVGLIGAALLAAAILPLSTAYSICDFTGSEAALDADFGEAKVFYLSNVVVTAIAAAVVLVPGVPLVSLLVSTQTLNAILLLALLVVMTGWPATVNSWATTPRAGLRPDGRPASPSR